MGFQMLPWEEEVRVDIFAPASDTFAKRRWKEASAGRATGPDVDLGLQSHEGVRQSEQTFNKKTGCDLEAAKIPNTSSKWRL